MTSCHKAHRGALQRFKLRDNRNPSAPVDLSLKWPGPVLDFRCPALPKPAFASQQAARGLAGGRGPPTRPPD
eukprot:8360396-Alexandrium_andersonii.AAC.1